MTTPAEESRRCWLRRRMERAMLESTGVPDFIRFLRWLSLALFLPACVCAIEPAGFCDSVDALGCAVDTATCRETTTDPTDCDIPDPEACLAELRSILETTNACQLVKAAATEAPCAEVCP